MSTQDYISYFPSPSVIDEKGIGILDPFSKGKPSIIAQTAASLLQDRLCTLEHNFGVDSNKEGRPIGKMMGVLVIKDKKGKLGYLSAFSGKLNNGNHYSGFVPPVYDGLQKGGFLNKGMTELSLLVNKIKYLQEEGLENEKKIASLIAKRKSHSQGLQQRLFSSYFFYNNKKESKSLLEIFKDRQPQGGSGECAAPKLLQYAFKENLRPIAITEFWWGIAPKSQQRIHGEYYPACEEKCRPILGWMLG